MGISTTSPLATLTKEVGFKALSVVAVADSNKRQPDGAIYFTTTTGKMLLPQLELFLMVWISCLPLQKLVEIRATSLFVQSNIKARYCATKEHPQLDQYLFSCGYLESSIPLTSQEFETPVQIVGSMSVYIFVRLHTLLPL